MKRNLLLAACAALPAFLLLTGCSSNPESSADTEGDEAWANEPGTPEAIVAQDQELPDDELVAQTAQDEALRAQKTDLLVSQHLELARDAYADARLLEAEDHLLKALNLSPGHREALGLLDQVQYALGRIRTPITDSGDDARTRTMARAAAIRASTEAALARAEALLAEGKYDEAIGAARLAQANMRGTTLINDWGGMEAQAASLLEQAEAGRDLAVRQQHEAEVAATYSEIQNQARTMDEAQQRRIDGLLQDATDAWEAGRYDKVELYATTILREEPLNEQALTLRDSARRARNEEKTSNFVSERSELFRSWEQELAAARVLQNTTLEYPDPEHWQRITELRKDFSQIPEDEIALPENAQVLEQLKTQKIPGLVFEGETSLEAVLLPLRTFTNIPYVVTPDAVDAVDSAGIEFTANLPHEMTALNALDNIVSLAGTGVSWTVRNGVVYLTSTARAHSNLMIYSHDVRDLIAQLNDFTPPKIDQIRLPDGEYSDEEPAFGGVAPEPVPVYNPDSLETLIKANVAPGTWDGEIEGASFRMSNGLLFVSHTPAVQKEIIEFLQGLRVYTSSMVTIEARFITITKDYLQEIGVDWRGNGGDPDSLDLVVLDDITSGLEDNASNALDNDGPGLPSGADTNPSAGAYFNDGLDGDMRARTENILSDYGSRLGVSGGLTMSLAFLDDLQYNLIVRAVNKREHAEELTGTTLSCQNTQRAYATMLNQITYVQDFDVEVALASIIADPIVGVISDGIVLDVRPTISQNRRYILLELRPTVATLLRPMPEFTSSLAGLTTPVTLQLPELQVASASTTALIPDGGAVVIGGLKKLFNLDQRSEIPFLGDIPILSLLFKTEGTVNENQDVILVIKATITDANEVNKNLDGLAAKR
jgi:Flp pilus assembly secretin CpaC